MVIKLISLSFIRLSPHILNRTMTENYVVGKIGKIGDCYKVCPGEKCDTCCKGLLNDPACNSVGVTDPLYWNKEMYTSEDDNDKRETQTETKTNIDIGVWIYITFIGVILLGLLFYLILKNRIK